MNFEKLKDINDFLAKIKDADLEAALIYRINPTTDSLKSKDILEYQNCVNFINGIKEIKYDDELLKVQNILKKDDINIVLASFNNYFFIYKSIKN